MLLGAKQPGYGCETTKCENRGETICGEMSWGRNDLLPYWIDVHGVVDSMPGWGSGIKSHSCAKPRWLNLTICF